MRSFTWLSSGSAPGRLHSGLERVRQLLLVQRPAVRWTLAAGTLAFMACLGYLGASSLSTSTERVFLGSGRSYSWDDVNKISRALDRQRVPFHVDRDRRVSVSRDQREEAEAAVAKLELGSRPPGEIRDQSLAPSPWESPRDREVREHRENEKILEAMIAELQGIVGCFVRLDQPKPRFGLQPATRPSAFVRLETEGDRQVTFQTVQSITTILRGYEPGLSAEAVTVVDRKGYKYLDAGNPALSVLSHNRAREEELSQEILDQLEWIKGVRVSVQLPDAPATVAVADTRGEPGRTESIDPKTQPTGSRPEAGAQESTAPVGALNRPLGAVEPVSPARSPSPPKVTVRETPPERGRVWVKVPKSFYYQVSMMPGRREPSVDELKKHVARTEELIRTGLSQVVPMAGPAAWTAMIDVIPDEIPTNSPSVVPSTIDSGRVALDWGIAGALGATAAALVLLASWALSVRRPAGRLETSQAGLRYHTGSSPGHGPSERLREFVRRNPDSAVSVLERWTSQGGNAS